MAEQKTVLLTGASSGIGQSTVCLLAQRGLTVFGTTRNPIGKEPIPGVVLLPLDLGSEESVSRCLAEVRKRSGCVDVLINNAGYMQMGAAEEVSIEEAEAQFDANFYGAMRMIRAVLPEMRQRGRGQIINMGSMVDFAPLPFMGVYSASKCALAGYTECLRHEVRPFGIKVSLVEPGVVKTNLLRNGQIPSRCIPEYDPWRQHMQKSAEAMQDRSPEPVMVAECVLRIINSRAPKLHYLVGKDATRISRVRKFLPEPLYEQRVQSKLGLDTLNSHLQQPTRAFER